VEINKEGDRMKLALELPQALLWVAGQEILNGAYYDQWLTELDSHDEVETRLLGQSIEGRPIYLASTAPQPEFVLLMGRQHPPEVTGAIAMQSFVRTVLGPSELALQFRNRFQLAIVPLVNPDGVAAGHWRHNAGGVDSNRDWGPFTQPETRAVIHWIENREAQGGQLQLSVDFHSTHEDLIYTQPTTENPVDFSSRWLNASALRLPHFPFKHSADPVSEQANSKNYFHTSRGIPAVTFESGDQTSRDQLKAAAVVFAEEMMRALLELPRG
jgi:predicted deacylase